jgi:hypothetical protein
LLVADFGVQAIGLAGVLMGALTTILATGITDRMRWRRGQGVRWDERRLSAYADFAQAIKDVYYFAGRLAASRVPTNKVPHIDRDEGVQQLAQAEARRSRAWETLLLLGDADSVRAARQWREAVWHVQQVALDPALGAAEWAAAVPAIDRSRDEFYVAARRSLGVAGGQVAQADWLSSSAPWAVDARR